MKIFINRTRSVSHKPPLLPENAFHFAARVGRHGGPLFSQRLFLACYPVVRIGSRKCSPLMRILKPLSEAWPRFSIFLGAAPRNAIGLDRFYPQLIADKICLIRLRCVVQRQEISKIAAMPPIMA